MPKEIEPVAVSTLSLYRYMKHILGEFDLEFHNMDRVTMTFTPHTVRFEHNGLSIETSNRYINVHF